MAPLRHQLAALVLQLVAPATLGETVVQALSQGIQAASLRRGGDEGVSAAAHRGPWRDASSTRASVNTVFT